MPIPESDAEPLVPARFLPRAVAWVLDACLALPPTALVCALLMRTPISNAFNQFRALKDTVDARAMDAVMEGNSLIGFVWSLQSDALIHAATRALAVNLIGVTFSVGAVFAVFSGFLHVFGETGAAHGSPGKRWMGLQVVSAHSGKPLTWPASLVRHLAGSLSWATLNLGHAMALLPPDHAALHDRVSGTRVITRARAFRN